MAIKGEWIRYGQHSGYLAVPERAALPLPGVLVIQEIWGVNAQIEDVTRRVAAAGYAALAPDLFALDGRRPPALTPERIDEVVAFTATLPPGSFGNAEIVNAALARLPEADRLRIGESLGQIHGSVTPDRIAGCVTVLRDSFRHLRSERPEARGQRVACVGFCMGGGLATLLACEEPELAGAASYYGRAPAAEKCAGIRCPVIAFYGAKDQRVNAGLPAFEEAMRAAGKSLEYRVYDGAGHAFFNDSSAAYEVRAARDSFARLLAFFAKNLTG